MAMLTKGFPLYISLKTHQEIQAIPSSHPPKTIEDFPRFTLKFRSRIIIGISTWRPHHWDLGVFFLNVGSCGMGTIISG